MIDKVVQTTEYTTKSEHYVDYGFEMIMICQHSFIYCNKCTMVQDMDSEGSYVGGWGGRRSIWAFSVSSALFYNDIKLHGQSLFLKRDPKCLSLKISKLTHIIENKQEKTSCKRESGMHLLCLLHW